MMDSFIQLIRCCVYLPFTALVKYNIQHPRLSETLPPFNFCYFFLKYYIFIWFSCSWLVYFARCVATSGASGINRLVGMRACGGYSTADDAGFWRDFVLFLLETPCDIIIPWCGDALLLGFEGFAVCCWMRPSSCRLRSACLCVFSAAHTE
jgi:hypothetical protein